VDRRFLNARSPLRVLEKGLHGGVGRGNLAAVVAGRGVGKTPFLVCVALDDLLRGNCVLHVSLEQTVPHVRAYYDTVFDELAASSHLEDTARVHAAADRNRRIRSYTAAAFDPAKLREAVKVETESGARPSLIVIEGMDLAGVGRDGVADLRALAQEIDAEIWLSASCPDERVAAPAALRAVDDLVSVVVALEPRPGHVALRVLKDHDNPDVEALHVALDPKSLLLVRS
jgi:hypothetical protein